MRGRGWATRPLATPWYEEASEETPLLRKGGEEEEKKGEVEKRKR